MFLILATWEAGIGRLVVEGQPGPGGQGVGGGGDKTWWHMPVIPAIVGSVK
jgi:hypothetical protein